MVVALAGNEQLEQRNACEPAITWLKEGNYLTIQEAWSNCKRGDWMLWLFNQFDYNDERVLRLMAVKFARQVQHLMKDERSIKALDVSERYANGEATEDELKESKRAAWAAAFTAAEAAAWAGWATEAAAWAARAAWEAARAARAAEEAEEAACEKQADIIREFIPDVSELWKRSTKQPIMTEVTNMFRSNRAERAMAKNNKSN